MMSIKRLCCIACLFLMLLGVMLPVGAFADSIFQTMAEDEAYDLVLSQHYIKARQKTEEILKKDPDSIGALYCLARIFWMGEGNHMRAMQIMRKTIDTFEKRYCQNANKVPDSSALQVWHGRFYKELADIYAELDMRQEEIDVHQKVADLYHAELSEDAVWALIKLDRFDEARRISEQSIKGHNSFWASRAYNDLTALEDARHRHLEAYYASSRSLEFSAGKSCVVLMNHARSCEVFLHLDDAIGYYLKATTARDRDCINSPYVDLAAVYLLDGTWQKAISALLKARKRRVEKRYQIAVEMEERTMMADILFSMGFAERAFALMKTVVEAPGRLGYDSLLKEQVSMGNNISYYAISNDALKRTNEALKAYYRLEPFWLFKKEIRSRVRELQKEYRDMSGRLWSTNQKVFKEALNPKNLKSFLVPFYVVFPLYDYAISDVLGRQTSEFFIQYQESILVDEEKKAMQPMFNHMRAYNAWRGGDDAAALRLLDDVEKDMPARMTLVVNQARLIRADILIRQGKQAEAYELMTGVYRAFPSVFRHLDVPLPVQFDTSMTANSDLKSIRDVLENSDRFRMSSDAPFVISGVVGDRMVQVCLSSKMGARFACSSMNPKDYSGDSETSPHLAEIVNNFYHHAFAPKVDISQSDLDSLDGSPVQISADEALEKLLNTSPLTGKARDPDDIEIEEDD